MPKFSNAKIGDRVWSSMFGWGTIEEIDLKATYALLVSFDECDGKERYSLYGYCSISHLVPTLFWNEFHIPSDEEDRKQFNLVEFLQLNVSYVEHDISANNYFIYYDYMDNCFGYSCSSCQEYIGVVYLDSSDFEYIVSELNEHNVTHEQLKKAYLELGWL